MSTKIVVQIKIIWRNDKQLDTILRYWKQGDWIKYVHIFLMQFISSFVFCKKIVFPLWGFEKFPDERCVAANFKTIIRPSFAENNICSALPSKVLESSLNFKLSSCLFNYSNPSPSHESGKILFNPVPWHFWQLLWSALRGEISIRR